MSLRVSLIASLACVAGLALARATLAQEALPVAAGLRVASSTSLVPIVFEGFVLEPDGAPAEGAVVVSSAGGRAVVDRNGRYRLDARVPFDARSVQITAFGVACENTSASTSVELSAAPRLAWVDPLRLTGGIICSSRWLPTFGEQPGTNWIVSDMAVFDDGSGAALYVAGYFGSAGSADANGIAKWDGRRWTALGSGLYSVNALAVYDDGGGPALYAGGSFYIADENTNIAKWNGVSWSPVGQGTGNTVEALTVYDDGGGPALFAGGAFLVAGGLVVNHIAKWDGSSWMGLGTGMGGGGVKSLAVYDDGGGPALYAGGNFTSAGSGAANGIAKWNGSDWTPLGSGASGVLALTVYDDGSGPALHAGGAFSASEGGDSYLAKWGCPLIKTQQKTRRR